MKLKDFIVGFIATAIALLALAIFSRIVWEAWDNFIAFLIERGYSPSIEYVLGFLVFIVAVWLGIVQLKKVGKT